MAGANFEKTSAPRITLHSLQRELRELRQRVTDLEDLRELNQAIERNGSKPLVPWSKAADSPKITITGRGL